MTQTWQEQSEAIKAATNAEALYIAAERQERLMSSQSTRFLILEHPYASMLSNAGHVLVAAHLWAEGVRPSKAKESARLIMEPGGIIIYDRQEKLDSIEGLTCLVPKSCGEISDIVWERRALEHVDEIVLCAFLASRLPEDYPSVRFTHPELLDMTSYAQACIVAKTRGVDALVSYRGELTW